MDELTIAGIVEKLFLPHFVAFTFQFYNIKNREKQYPSEKKVFSGFVFQSGHRRYLASAGHIFSTLDLVTNGAADEKFAQPSLRLLAGFHRQIGKLSPIPLTYPQSGRFLKWKYEQEDEFSSIGCDYGFYELNNLEIENLRKEGVRPFIHSPDAILTEDNSGGVTNVLLVGIPNAQVESISEYSSNISPAIINLSLPQDNNFIVTHSKRLRYVFELPNEYPYESVKGMSGGPVIGYHENFKDRVWLLGIQSGELPSSRKVFVSPFTESLIDAGLHSSGGYY